MGTEKQLKYTTMATKTKKQNVFQTNWATIKNEIGTINQCLAMFANIVNETKNKQIIETFGKYFTDKSNKELNKLYYGKIKQFAKIGEKVHIKRNIKGCETVYEYTKKCSVYDIYRYFAQLAKSDKK